MTDAQRERERFHSVSKRDSGNECDQILQKGVSRTSCKTQKRGKRSLSGGVGEKLKCGC